MKFLFLTITLELVALPFLVSGLVLASVLAIFPFNPGVLVSFLRALMAPLSYFNISLNSNLCFFVAKNLFRLKGIIPTSKDRRHFDDDNWETDTLMQWESFDKEKKASKLSYAIWTSTLDFLRLLLEKNANTEAQRGIYATLLHVAVEKGNVDIVELFLDSGANTEAQRGIDGTPLHVAVEKGKTKIVRLLLKKNANIEAQRGSYGTTPLHVAVENGQVDIVRLLLKHVDKISCDISSLPDSNILLKNAMRLLPKLRDEILTRFKVAGYTAPKSDLESHRQSHEVLIKAIDSKSVDKPLVERLMKLGVPINPEQCLVKGRRYDSALLEAIKKNDANLVKILLEYGACVSPVYKIDCYSSPIYVAFEKIQDAFSRDYREVKNDFERSNFKTQLDSSFDIIGSLIKSKTFRVSHMYNDTYPINQLVYVMYWALSRVERCWDDNTRKFFEEYFNQLEDIFNSTFDSINDKLTESDIGPLLDEAYYYAANDEKLFEMLKKKFKPTEDHQFMEKLCRDKVYNGSEDVFISLIEKIEVKKNIEFYNTLLKKHLNRGSYSDHKIVGCLKKQGACITQEEFDEVVKAFKEEFKEKGYYSRDRDYERKESHFNQCRSILFSNKKGDSEQKPSANYGS